MLITSTNIIVVEKVAMPLIHPGAYPRIKTLGSGSKLLMYCC